ncbi:MAG TPA: aminotransferase class V-fold PLP-dependent enzyme [Gemmata sp.]|jgi:L-seryl-tRNA(Ser) seleniumtransferase|nr:aminotransferase class V-fold PLP-dependent enzyme [Gemmata sp.]
MSELDHRNVTRRDVLQAGAGLAASGVLASSSSTSAAPLTNVPSPYEALGLKHVINATGTVTVLGGSVMPPEVVTAWAEASKHFVDLLELQDKVGQKIAQLLDVEAAMVTTGAAGALLLGTAAAATRGDRKLIARLPDTTGAKNEVLIQKTHHSCYDNQLTDVGIRLIEVETVADVTKAITGQTAVMFFMNVAESAGKINREEWVALARQKKIPTLIDAAADVPPINRIAEFFKLGFDLVAISGGKAIRGPNDTGLLLGRKDLIEAAKRNANPHCGTIGRMMKVSKEDMIALLAAVERFVKLDPVAEAKELDRRIAVIEKTLSDLPTIKFERIVPPIANHVPHLQITWDEKHLKITREKVTHDLLDGDPRIRIGRVAGTGDKGILISVLTLQEGEERIVATRLCEILKKEVN